MTAEEVRAEGVPEALVPHRVFGGNRPSNRQPELAAGDQTATTHDSSTDALIRRYRQLREKRT